ncbi:dihydroxyacetone kinase [Fulvitalea axinellae]|uniref:Dihydroxyacetone kinase n=1 Tax=Fulvitalea axinellae TaxID=1182444 RepID=A0AAU9DD44_9BACT|nr:dihydroxyacetone kinase [Fulvitalea axinellae]
MAVEEKVLIKKFINNPETITQELLEGYTMAYADKVALGGENIVVRANPKSEDKVAIVSMGGSGHEPAISGFVGEGMLDCSVVGDIFAAPGAPRVFEALKKFDRGAGILLVVLNHAGDVMSANMAMQLAERAGIKVKMLMTSEDISAGLDVPDEDRRGLAGCIPLYKIAGAAAEEGKSLDEIYEIAERFNKQMATLAVAMKSCTHPQNGATIAELPDGEMEIGMGQHGEGGGGRSALLTADETAERMIGQLMKKLSPAKGDKVVLYINGVGATTMMELFLVYRKAHQILVDAGCEVVEGKVDEFLTVQEMAGFQMILGKVDDDHATYLKHVSDAPYWTVLK